MNFIYLNIVRLSWFFGALILFTEDKLEFQKMINRNGTTLLDSISKILTHAGDGVFAITALITFLFIRIKTAVLLVISFLMSAGIVQFLKRVVFSNMKRPFHLLSNDPDFRIIHDFNYHTANSFPSGHSASIFAICTVIAYTYRNKITWQVILAAFAILIGFTRVYLCQHYLQDVIAGSLIGTLVGYYTCVLLQNKINNLDKPLRIR